MFNQKILKRQQYILKGILVGEGGGEFVRETKWVDLGATYDI